MIFITASPVFKIRSCTSAIVSAKVSQSGRPLLWKNRDTSELDNKVAYVAPHQEGEIPFVALFNASDRDLQQAWIGMNAAGFAIMNTASYNLNNDDVAPSKMDREGFVMALALKHCRSVDDFEQLLISMPKPLGVEANFGVIDALGNGAFFETGNFTFKRFDLSDEPSGVLIRTNFSYSGRSGEGFGQIRARNAAHLLEPFIRTASIAPETFTEHLSCSFYHSLFDTDMLINDCEWIIDQDFIPRYSTSASVVIEGIPPIAEASEHAGLQYVMWTALGYPPCAEVTPVTCSPSGVDPSLQGLLPGGKAEACERAMRRKAEVFSAPDGNRARYIHIPSLINASSTGYLTVMRKLNRQTYEKYNR